MARYCSTTYHRMAGHNHQKHWVIKRSTVDKFDEDNKFFNWWFQTKKFGNVEKG